MEKKDITAFVTRVWTTAAGLYKGKKYATYRITIPRRVVKKLGISAGDYVIVTVKKVELSASKKEKGGK